MSGSIFSKIIVSFLAIILLYIYPLYQGMERQDDRSQMVVQRSVTRFVDAVRTKGYVTPTMYRQFNEEIAATGNVFDIEMVHEHKLYIPVYRDAANQARLKANISPILVISTRTTSSRSCFRIQRSLIRVKPDDIIWKLVISSQ